MIEKWNENVNHISVIDKFSESVKKLKMKFKNQCFSFKKCFHSLL